MGTAVLLHADVLERVGVALADGTRRRILLHLLDGPAYPAELAETLVASRAGVSNHNALEGLVAIASGLVAGSIALLGFGADSYVEVSAGVVVLWRLAAERRGREVSEAAERRAVRLIAVTFFLLAVGVGVESLRTLLVGEHPAESLPGIALAAVSLGVMPLLARAKRRVGRRLGSQALQADATQTSLCVWLSAILLAGLGLNALAGWWWADPVAALGVVYVAAREGVENWRAEHLDDGC